jgi:hypothetical protein
MTTALTIANTGASTFTASTTNASLTGTTFSNSNIITSSSAYYWRGIRVNNTGSYINTGITNSGIQYGINSELSIDSTSWLGTLTSQAGFYSDVGITSCGVGGTITNVYGYNSLIRSSDADGTITNAYAFYSDYYVANGGVITNKWGLYVTGAEKNYISGTFETQFFKASCGTAGAGAASDTSGLNKFVSLGTNQAESNIVVSIHEEDAETNSYMFVCRSGNATFGSATDRFYVSSAGKVYVGSNFACNGATPQGKATHIADPSGGATTDAEARTAINSILTVLENYGFVATS